MSVMLLHGRSEAGNIISYSMVGGCLIVASYRQSTAVHYPASWHYQATKARRYISMATCLETLSNGCLSGSSRKRKQEGLDVVIHYIKLNLVINDSDFVILSLDLLIFGSDKCTML